MDDPVITNPATWWQYGVLGIAVLVFAWVIIALFRKYEGQIKQREAADAAAAAERQAWAVERERTKNEYEQRFGELETEMIKERQIWQVERERLRAEYDGKYHDVIKEYAAKLQEEHRQCQIREDQIRKEHAEMIEAISSEQAKSAESLTTMLEKLQDRFVFRGR